MALTQEQTTKYEALFKKYPVAISHLHQQLIDNQLGLVLGAGIGQEIGFPNWKELIYEIAVSNDVEGTALFNNPEKRTVTSQMLFQLFKQKYLSTENGLNTYSHYGDIELRKKWKELVRSVLYAKVSNDPGEWIKSCPYLLSLIKIIQNFGTMTVTYNFDDTIERLLHKNKKTQSSRGYTVVWDTNVQTEKRPNIVYHPNGYLPRKKSEFTSQQLIFLEDTFEDQLVDSFNGHYNALHNYYSSKTCLFLGISLNDHTLKHMLYMNAKKCYGHMHYLVQYTKNHSKDKTKEQSLLLDTETKTNFDIYNLYTLYLTSDEIDTLLSLIQLPPLEFNQICRNMIKIRKFFAMGAVAAGKSTTVNQYKCFLTFDEWLEELPDDMEKAPSAINAKREKEIDIWIAEQISRKNDNLNKETLDRLPCIAVIDRTPLDAFAFFDNNLMIPPDNETQSEKAAREKKLNDLWKNKAKLHQSKHPHNSPLVGGKIVFLRGDIDEMEKRAKQKFREYGQTDLKTQQNELLYIAENLKAIYGDNSVAVIDVTNKSIEQVTKEVAEIIYFKEYAEVDFQKALESIIKKGRNFNETKALHCRAVIQPSRKNL